MSGSGISDDKTQKGIEAVDFQAPTAPSAEPANATAEPFVDSRPVNITDLVVGKNAPWWHSQFNLMLAVFGMLALAAVALILLAPDPDENGVVVGSDTSSAVTTPASNYEAPWDENRRAQARSDSQAILSNLLDSKKSLEQKDVQQWAPDRFNQALQKAAQGDEFYKLQDYAQAIASYQASVDELDSLFERIPELVRSKIAEGNQALADGKSQLARQSFGFALKLEPGNILATDALGRANKLDQVLALLQAAETELQTFQEQDRIADLTSAESKIVQALEVDPLYQRSLEIQKRIQQQLRDKRYRAAMSKGYASLFKSNFSSARAAFSQALKIKPDDPTADAAYRQSLASNKSSSLASLLRNAGRFVKNEDWQNALSNFQAVLQRDPNQVAAKLGEIRSRARSQLDSLLREALADPLALSKASSKGKADVALSEARAISKKGSKLKQQIASLEQALQASSVVIKVQFLSNELTDVSLRKAGAQRISLGRFSAKNLALKPGRYVVSGVRNGFRDVRKEIDLYPNTTGVQSISIRCDDPVSKIDVGRSNDQV